MTQPQTAKGLDIQTPAAFAPLLESHRYKGARGGRASAKSHFFGSLAVELAYRLPGLRVACLREVQKSLQLSSKLLISDKVKTFGLEEHFQILNNEIRTRGDGMMIFQGMSDQTADSIKSLEGFDVFWFEEAQTMSARSLELLKNTVRHTPRSVMVPELWFSWNPGYPTDPVDMHFNANPPDSKLIHVSYRDNPWFPPEMRAEMEWDRSRDPEKYAHVWEGDFLSRSEARVFNNWKIADFEVPPGLQPYYGADWGFSVDPTVLIRVYIDHAHRKIYVDREAYQVGCEIDNIPTLFDKLDPATPKAARAWTITADSARPETISYVKRNGYPRIMSAKKGPGSIEDGIEFLKNYDIVIHSRCKHTIDEMTHYSYKVDRMTDQVLPILADKNNHVIDSLRYAVEGVRHGMRGLASSTTGLVSKSYDGAVAIPDLIEEGFMSTYDGSIT